MIQVKEYSPRYSPIPKIIATNKSWIDMGRVYADIELISTRDIILSKEGMLEENAIRRATFTFIVDGGADDLCINEHIKNQLQLPVLEERIYQLADGTEVTFEVVGPVDLRFDNRRAVVEAVVLPGVNEPLLGAIPMEIMDVLIHPRKQILTVNPANPLIAKHNLK